MPEDDPNQQKPDTAQTYHEDTHTDPYVGAPVETTVPATISSAPPPPPPTATKPAEDEEDQDDEGMLRMSFLEHLEELRSRIMKALMGLGIAFALSLTFSQTLFNIVREPATVALLSLGYSREEAVLIQTQPMEAFFIIWMKLPLLTALFLASPWVLFQVWSFVAPGLYKRERRLAVPFILCSAGLFILGGLFAYFVAFRFGLTFLLGVGRDVGVRPMITVTEYFDIFVNVILGVGVVFELPVLIFFVILLRLVSARFLVTHSRYAVLAIVVLAAIVTPTPDVFNLMLFAVPMVFLYFIGIFAGYLLELSRENKKFPWGTVAVIAAAAAALIGSSLWIAVTKYGFKLVDHWPFLVR
jgi:sec-independent protein translocase protein TatC